MPVPSAPAASAPPTASPRISGSAPHETPWRTHRLNASWSWKLIYAIVPSLPRVAARLLAHTVSAACFLLMMREREAVVSNLSRVRGRLAPRRAAYRVFHNFSRFMVAYACLRRFGRTWLLSRLDGAPEVNASLSATLAEGRGMILLTMHLGQWDMGLSLLDQLGAPTHVVMRRSEPDEILKLVSDTRGDGDALRVHMVGESPLVGVELMAALMRGEVVAMQADRAAGAQVLAVPLFGAPALLPTGPVRLALATGAPIVPVFTLLGENDRFRLVALDPVRLGRHRGDALEPAVNDGMLRLASLMESMIARHDEQWFNFFDVWSGGAEASTHAGRAREAAHA